MYIIYNNMRTRNRKKRSSTRKKGGSTPATFSDRSELRRETEKYFKNANSQNDVIATYGHISNWNTSRVRSMDRIFENIVYGDGILHEPVILNWNTNSVTNMSYMFKGCMLDIQIHFSNTSNVTNMSGMFQDNKIFNSPLEHMNVSSVTNMSYMFDGATRFNQSLNKWKLKKNVMTRYIFGNPEYFNTRKYNMAFDRIKNCFMWYYRKTIGKLDASSLTNVFTYDEITQLLPKRLPVYNYIYISNMLDEQRKNNMRAIQSKIKSGIPLTPEEEKQKNDYTTGVSHVFNADVIDSLLEQLDEENDFAYEGYQEYADEYTD